MINITNTNDFLLDGVQVYPSRNQLVAEGKELTLQPQVMAVLCYLAHHQERVVSSEELMEQLWKGRIVTQGSVQKSINFLRKALAEFFGDKEIVCHYSKRGYQLTLVPEFISGESGLVSLSLPVSFFRRASVRNGILIGLVCVALLVVAMINREPQQLAQPEQTVRVHKTHFNSVSDYSTVARHLRDAEPHPNNTHVAYIRERLLDNNQWEVESELVIRNNKGEDWLLANSEGSWVSLAWSPGGQHLVAVEVWRQEGLPPTPNFFERPNYLYTFHVFSLDLASNRLLEKHLLSQWQGRIFSVTWWDDHTLEFVATQGPDSSHERYRYTTDGQQLSVVESAKASATPLVSAVLNKKTGVVSAQGNRVKIELLDEQQLSQASWMLDRSWMDISWIPDGSGVLAFSEAQQKLLALYWDGQRLEIPVQRRPDKSLSKPRYRPDGSAIYYTEETSRSIIWWLDNGREKQSLADFSEIHHAAAFSASGEAIAFGATYNQEHHLWLREGKGQPRQLSKRPLREPVSHIIWSNDATHIVYKTGRQIVFYELATGKQENLRLESDDIEPLAFDSKTQQLFITKSVAETKNIWSLHTQTLQQKQLTFGALGSVLQQGGSIYFQYRGKRGLWALQPGTTPGSFSTERVNAQVDENSLLLGIDDQSIYFISGGRCRESDVYRFDLAQSKKTVFLARPHKIVSSHGFHPREGILQSDCLLPESSIMLLN